MMSQPACCLKKLKLKKSVKLPRKKSKSKSHYLPSAKRGNHLRCRKVGSGADLEKYYMKHLEMAILLLKLNERQTHEF